MDYRHLGRSGLRISEIAYGNWITHGSQVEETAALACVRAALDEGITTFDTADVYARGRAEEVLGRALHGVRRESIEICTKVFWPIDDGPNDRGLSRKHITESLRSVCRGVQSSGCRLIGPYSARESSSSVTWSTPTASSARQFSPSQLSASPWLTKIASCRSSAETTVPSAFSYRHVQGIDATPLSPVSGPKVNVRRRH